MFVIAIAKPFRRSGRSSRPVGRLDVAGRGRPTASPSPGGSVMGDLYYDPYVAADAAVRYLDR